MAALVGLANAIDNAVRVVGIVEGAEKVGKFIGDRLPSIETQNKIFNRVANVYRPNLPSMRGMKRKASSSRVGRYKKRKTYKKSARYSRPNIVSKSQNFSGSGKKSYGKKFKKLLRFNRKVDMALDATAGRQITINTTNQTCSASADQCNSICFTLNTCVNGTDAENWGDLNRVFGHAFNTLTAAAFAADERNSLFLRSVNVEFSIRDSATSNAKLKIYECICRKSAQAQGNLNSIASSGWSTFVNAEVDPARSLTGTAALTGTHSAWTPFMMHNFCKHFKILKTHDIYLESSQSIYFKKSYRFNKLISPKQFHDHDVIKGLSRIFIFQVYGDLDTTTGEPSAAGVKIEMNVNHVYSTQGTQTNVITVGGDRPA